MSLNGPDVAEEVLSVLQTTWIVNCCCMAGSALVLYDYVVTLSREVEFIWGRKWSSVTLLFYLNRWTTFIWAIEQLPLRIISMITLPGCIGYLDFDEAITLLLFTIWAVFSGIRMYAISGRNWWLASAVGLLNMTPVGVNAYINFAAVWYEIGYIPILGESCISGYNISNTTNIAFSIGTRGSVITADILILVVTWIKTYLTYRNAARNNIKTPVLALLLKDGAIYFMMLLSLNIITIVGELTNVFIFTATLFTTPLSSIIITHFLLNLRQVTALSLDDTLDKSDLAFTRSRYDSQSHSWRSRLSFNHSFVDNMGEDLAHGFDTSISNLDTAGLKKDTNVETQAVVNTDEEPGCVAFSARPNGQGQTCARGISQAEVDEYTSG